MACFRCPECGYRFEETRGDPDEGYPAGTRFRDLPEDFACPDCSVRFRDDFERIDQAAETRPAG